MFRQSLWSFLICLMSPALQAAEKEFTWNFNDHSAGTVPTGWRVAKGDWTVTRQGDQQVLSQGAHNADSVFNLVLETEVLFSDVDVQVQLKSNSGVVDQGGGIAWRAKNASTYYVARYNPLEDSFRVYKVVDGKRFQLGSTKVSGDNEWHTLRVRMTGDEITCTLDEKQTLHVHDQSIRGYGRIGLWTKSDAQSSFDDLVATGNALSVPTVPEPGPAREFEIRNERPYLGGHEVDLWGLRCGNGLLSDAVTERYVRNFDNMNAHGINMVGVYIQGVNAGFPDGNAGFNGFSRHGKLLPEAARRIEFLVREADRRGMVVMIGVITPRKDQDFYADEDLRRAIEETAHFLQDKQLRNVFVNLCDEFNHPLNADKLLIREPGGAAKKDLLTSWFKAIAPDIEVGVGPHWKAETGAAYPTMDVCILQKGMPIPEKGFVINVEPIREDYFNNDGIFNAANLEAIFTNCRNYLDAPNAVFMFHSGFLQGVTNYSGTAPHGEMGGYGTGPTDRGIRFYYEWVRDNVGRWEYPHHVPCGEFSIEPQGGRGQ